MEYTTEMKDYDTSKIEIEKGVAVPKKGGKRPNKWFYIFVKMNVGDSIAIPYENENEQKSVRRSLYMAYRNYKEIHDPNFVATTRILFKKNEIRLWRDA